MPPNNAAISSWLTRALDQAQTVAASMAGPQRLAEQPLLQAIHSIQQQAQHR